MNEKGIVSLTQPGYLTSMQVVSPSGYQNLPDRFAWENIPMFSVVTGKNGTGKSNLLQGILFGLHKNQQQIRLKFQEDTKIAEICSLQNTDRICTLSSNTEEDSKNAFKEKSGQILEDLKRYAFFKQLDRSYELEFKENKIFYDLIIKKAESSTLQLNSFSFSQYELELKKHFDRESEAHLSEYNSLENTAKRILETSFYAGNPHTKEEKKVSLENALLTINSYLESKQFKYRFSEESFNWSRNSGCFDTLALIFPPNRSLPIIKPLYLNALSSGEKLELLVLLWRYEQRKSFKNAILIMDEPDAHLHPSLVKEIIETLKTKIIQEWGIQVIMTTHNPTTVSLIPKECLWVLRNDAPIYQPQINHVASKKEAIQLLTSDFVSVNEPFKLVFVEAESDKEFYQTIREKLMVEKLIYLNEQILFMAHSKNKKNSSCDLVESIVENCVEHSGDEDKNLREHIFGIVDGDNKQKHKSNNILATRRYSIENYIYDPIHIFFCVKNKNPNLESFKKIERRVKYRFKILGILVDPIPSLDEIMRHEKKNSILQTIAACVTGSVMFFFQKKLEANDSEFEDVFEKLNGDRFRHLLIESPEGKKQITREMEDIKFINDVQLSYPKFFLEMQGHCLEFIYSRFFPGNGYSKEEKFINKAYIMKVVCKHAMLIPEELADLFIALQKPVKHLDQEQKQDSKKSELAASQLEEKLERFKKEATTKDKKMKNQREKIKELEKKIVEQKATFVLIKTFFEKARCGENSDEIRLNRQIISEFTQQRPECILQ